MPIAVVSLAVRKSIHREVDGNSFAVKKSCFTNGLSYCKSGGPRTTTSNTGSKHCSSLSTTSRRSVQSTGPSLTGAAIKTNYGAGPALSSYSSSSTLKAGAPTCFPTKGASIVVTAAMLKRSGRGGSSQPTRSF